MARPCCAICLEHVGFGPLEQQVLRRLRQCRASGAVATDGAITLTVPIHVATLATCRHTFCARCLGRFIKTHQAHKHHLVCPLCRRSVLGALSIDTRTCHVECAKVHGDANASTANVCVADDGTMWRVVATVDDNVQARRRFLWVGVVEEADMGAPATSCEEDVSMM